MVLNDISDSAGLLVERAPTLNAETLGHRDLNRFDVVAVPDGLQEGIGEAKEQEVLDRLLAQVVVDSEDTRFRIVLGGEWVQGSRGLSRVRKASRRRRARWRLAPESARCFATVAKRLGGIAR